LLPFLFSPYLFKGLGLLRSVRAKVRVISDVVELAAQGDGKVSSVTYRKHDGTAATLPVDQLLLHQGVVPNVNLAMSIGIEHFWDDEQLCWSPRVSPFGATSVPGIYVAGDGAGIAGGQAAAWRG